MGCVGSGILWSMLTVRFSCKLRTWVYSASITELAFKAQLVTDVEFFGSGVAIVWIDQAANAARGQVPWRAAEWCGERADTICH